METRPTGTALRLSCVSEACKSSLTALDLCISTAQTKREAASAALQGPQCPLVIA